jgi:signal transduction histidine kinase
VGAAHSAENRARPTPVDFSLIFARSAPACLVLQPDAPRYTVLAASDALLVRSLGSSDGLLGRSLFDVLGCCPFPLNQAPPDALRLSLETAVRTRETSRLPLEALDDVEPPSSQISSATRWAVVHIPVVESAEVRYIVQRVEEMPGAALERELRQRSRELDEARNELDAFSYSVAHDLRAPLRAIDGFSQALSHDYAAVLDEQAQHFLGRVRAGAQRMSALIDGLLELSKTLRAPLRRVSVDLSEIARRELDALQRSHPDRSVEIEVEGGLGASADTHLINVVMEKLLDNAFKFTARTPNAKLRVGGRVEDDGARSFFVADNGVGFDMAYATRLFTPFQRLHKSTDFEGTGVGLSIAHRIITRHGGKLWAEAVPNHGACFRFTLGHADG